MGSEQFLARCLCLDLEVRGENLLQVGAVLGDWIGQSLEEVERMAGQADFVLGHNVLEHDLPFLRRRDPGLRLLTRPAVDTLLLSPLAFPENPYHRLVKDYKLVRETLNDPVADAKLAARLFRDEWKAFETALGTGGGPRMSVVREGFEGFPGLLAVFDALGVEPGLGWSPGERACRTAWAQGVSSGPARAYAATWLEVAGASSVVPAFVRRRFPEVVDVLDRLREIPCEEPGCVYCRQAHSPVQQLGRYFGFAGFRSDLQEAITRSGLRGKPLLAILPTGGGKSLCYQLPALARHARRGVLTVVVSPLQALMKDQVDNLARRSGVSAAAALSGLLTPPERGKVLEGVRLGDTALLYVAPEQLRNRSFREAIASREIGAWVFDEAHCLSKWGHDFRPDYLYASRFIRELAARQKRPVPPIACFTATAKQDVQREILEHFQAELGQTLEVFESGVERPNLRFEVLAAGKAEKPGRIQELLAERLPPQSGAAVIYTATRQGAEQAAGSLKRLGWAAEAFHAGLPAPRKREVQDAFLRGELRVICATNAFGMGIDKEDVRLVIHSEVPGSLESYLQEAGRAGRDLAEAECVLLYDEQDVEVQFQLQARSELSRKDVEGILRGLRKARRNAAGEVVLTPAEILRIDETDTGLEIDDRQADTKVKAAVAWLERAALVQRNENETRVFQGQPRFRSLAEAAARMEPLGLEAMKKRRWLALLGALYNADPDEGLRTDVLAELPELQEGGPSGREEGEGLHVLRTLHEMAAAGLIRVGLQLTAFVRHKVKDPSKQRFQRISELEQALLEALREEAPDAAEEEELELSVRRLNQRLRDAGHDSSPETLRLLLSALGPGLRHISRDRWRLRLRKDWGTVLELAERRRATARVALETVLAKIAPEVPASAELLVSFTAEDVAAALRADLFLGGQDLLSSVNRGLLYLHEHKVLHLQQGLAVFRQAMTIRIPAEASGRRYTKADDAALRGHYQERLFQIHAMNEYARRGLENLASAQQLASDYFGLEKPAFVRRHFAGRRESLERGTGPESYARIVGSLSQAQLDIVTAPEETNLLVLAGPGSGKTRVVVHRCAYLLRVLRVPAEGLLAVCFNRSAAVTLRRRLHELVGPDARGVTVQTYHGLALRLTGTSLATRAEGGKELDLDAVIPQATRLLRGETEVGGLEPDELRDQLMSGYRHILVDEYQDINEEQYQLVSALAGRTEQEPDRKLNILAVGDDDQNIYTFQGANVELLRRFQQDYGARLQHLVENYRSTAAIVDAANCWISQNRDRMKASQPIRVDTARQAAPPGGDWSRRDALGQGRVQILEVHGEAHQAAALVAELSRLGVEPQDCAVLARRHETLAPLRTALEHHGIPLTWSFKAKAAPPLHRLREIAAFLEALRPLRGSLRSVSELRGLLPRCHAPTPWSQLLDELLGAWAEESGGASAPVNGFLELVHESLAAKRRERQLGHGLFLGTVHSAKGLEFRHVFLPDGDWSTGLEEKALEEERRVFYVGMTRARETLCLFERLDRPSPHLRGLTCEGLLRRSPGAVENLPEGLLARRYELLGPSDVNVGFAGERLPRDPIHRHLAALHTGDLLAASVQGDRVVLQDGEGQVVAQLSWMASKHWKPHLAEIEEIRVIGLVQRDLREEDQTFREHHQYRCERWEWPWVEVVHRPSRSG